MRTRSLSWPARSGEATSPDDPEEVASATAAADAKGPPAVDSLDQGGDEPLRSSAATRGRSSGARNGKHKRSVSFSAHAETRDYKPEPMSPSGISTPGSSEPACLGATAEDPCQVAASPGGECAYAAGQMVQVYSTSHGGWVEAKVASVSRDGALQVAWMVQGPGPQGAQVTYQREKTIPRDAQPMWVKPMPPVPVAPAVRQRSPQVAGSRRGYPAGPARSSSRGGVEVHVIEPVLARPRSPLPASGGGRGARAIVHGMWVRAGSPIVAEAAVIAPTTCGGSQRTPPTVVRSRGANVKGPVVRRLPQEPRHPETGGGC